MVRPQVSGVHSANIPKIFSNIKNSGWRAGMSFKIYFKLKLNMPLFLTTQSHAIEA